MNIDDLLTKDKKTITKINVEEKKVSTGKKMGRPKKTVKADKKVSCYLTDEELEEFEMLANMETLSKSALTRKIILKFIKDN